MNQPEMEAIVKNMANDAEGESGFVQFSYQNTQMVLISDTTHDRMRIIAAITDTDSLSQEQVDAILESNFHTALDARYASSDGILYAAYIHPLSYLHQAQIESAVIQVANLAQSFGSSYSSGQLSFGGAH